MNVKTLLDSRRSLRTRALASNRHDVLVTLLVLMLCLLPSWRFYRNWFIPVDGSWYLLQGLNLVSGNGFTVLGNNIQTIRGPVFPSLLALLMVPLGTNPDLLVLTVRSFVVLNPILMYFLVKRLAGTVAGVIGAVLLALFGDAAIRSEAMVVDDVQLSLYLLALIALLSVNDRRSNRHSFLSGLLLGVAILTKETAIVALPLGVLAGLVFWWDIRTVLWYYVGVSTLCLPWWAWIWRVDGTIYLVGKPPGMVPSVVLVTMVVAGLGLLVWFRSWVVQWLVTQRRHYHTIAWGGLAVWISLLSASLWAGNQPSEFQGLSQMGSYFRARVLNFTPAWYLLPLGVLCIAGNAARGYQTWRLYLFAILVWIPVIIFLLLAQFSSPRQWTVMQALLYGGLAASFGVVGGRMVSLPSRALRLALLLVLFAFAVHLSGLAVTRIDVLASHHVNQNENPSNMVNNAVRAMSAHVADNVPRGEGILTSVFYAYQLTYLDSSHHSWQLLQMDCANDRRGLATESACLSRPVQLSPSSGIVWFHVRAGCHTAVVSIEELLRQMDNSDSNYLLLSPDERYPYVFTWLDPLEGSGAFRTQFVSYTRKHRHPEKIKGLALLERTGVPARPVVASTYVVSLGRLIACRKAESGERYAEEIRATFPSGIRVVGKGSDSRKARSLLRAIYGEGGS